MAKQYDASRNQAEATPSEQGLSEVNLFHIPELKEFEITDVEYTGKWLGYGPCGNVEEVQIPQSVCLERGFNWSAGFAAKTVTCATNQSLLLPLISECFLMNKVCHPNLALFLGISYKPGEAHLPALIMEQLETSLHDKLLERTEFPLELRIGILLDVSKGLSYLHSMSPPLCHCDLTAKNILLSSDGVAKIADFGMAKIIEKVLSLSSSIYLTKNHGYLYYMPPEASESPAKYSTPPIDVFSFGVVALFAGTREFPTPLSQTFIDEKTDKLVARSEIERRQKFLDKLSNLIYKNHPLNGLVKQCLDYRPKKRPSAKNLQVMLQAMLPESPRKLKETILYPQELKQYLVPPHGCPLKLGKRIGGGSYGTVYEVEVRRRPFIAKRLHDILIGREQEEPVGVDTKDSYHEKFLRECILLSQMKHPNIVEFIGVHFGQDKYDLTLIMERLSNDLARYLKQHQGISLTQKVSILHDVSNGLLYMHKKSVLHRDLSAANIFLSSSLQAKIGDLGVSRVLDRTLPELSKAPGALSYMAPETLKDKAIYNEMADIFSYGVIVLFVAVQEFPEYSYHRIPDEIDLKGEGEIFKRRAWIEKMEVRQPELCSLVLHCLRDDSASRPNTATLNSLVSELHKSCTTGTSA